MLDRVWFRCCGSVLKFCTHDGGFAVSFGSILVDESDVRELVRRHAPHPVAEPAADVEQIVRDALRAKRS